MTADYVQDIAALEALIRANQGNANADQIQAIIDEANDRRQALDDALAALEPVVQHYCRAWENGKPGPILLGEALKALDIDALPPEMTAILRNLKDSIDKVSGGGGGGNAAWPSNYVSSSS